MVGWLIVIALCYAPIIYRIHRRLHKLETRLVDMEAEMNRWTKTGSHQ